MSATPVGVPLEGDSDIFVTAQNILRLASSPWSPPTQESLDMALAAYQAAMKLHNSPPLYKADNTDDVETLQQRLAAVTEELRVTRQELRDAREETARAFLALNERFSHLLDSPVGQSYKSDTAAVLVSLADSVQNDQDTSITEAANVGSPSVEEDTTTVPAPAREATEASGITDTSETETLKPSAGDAMSESQKLELVRDAAPARVPENRWTPSSAGRNRQPPAENTPEVVEKKIKGLLNKLSSENFDSVATQIAGWINQSAESEKNGETLALVIKLIFEKATDEPHWSELYAKLCKKLKDMISPSVQDVNSRNMAGEFIVGGQLLRKFLLNTCQQNFERGWLPMEVSTGASGGSEDIEPEMGSDEYYSRVKAKRQGLGLIRFIGELFKMGMVTERIIHECIKRLLPDLDDPNEAEVESLCKLLTTVGEILDVPKSKAFMDRYFGIIRMVADNDHVASRLRYMIMDVIELRQRHWRPRNAETASPLSTQSHEQALRSQMTSALGRRWRE